MQLPAETSGMLELFKFTSRKLAPASAHRSGAAQFATLSTVVLLTVVAAAGGYRWWNSNGQEPGMPDAILHTVTRGDFVHQITERGEILSSAVTEIRSQVKTKNTPGVAILRVIEEGTKVKAGDFLCQLDSSALEAELTTQQIVVNTNKAFDIESRNIYETALIAKREYIEGTYLQERQTNESEIFVAEENLNRAREYYKFSNKMASKGYINQLQLEADKFAVEKSSKELEAAQTKLMVLDDFTKAKMLKQFESDIVIAKAKWESQTNSLELEMQQLRDIEEQIANCTIVAPRDGMVKYAHTDDRRGEADFIVEEGTLVRERQTILTLPDPASMNVEITINESLIQYVHPGMPTTVLPVGLDGIELKGTVQTVSQYAEPSGWRKANVKEYKAIVSLDEASPEIRAGMTASVIVQCTRVPGAIQVPVQSVYAHGEQYYCFVYDKHQWQARPVQCGPTNDKFFVVESGVGESDRVALNPRRFLDRVDLPNLAPEQRQRAVPQKSEQAEEVALKETSVQLAKQRGANQRAAGKPNSGG